MEWISVKDRIPELHKYVLCAVSLEGITPPHGRPPKIFTVAYCYDRNEYFREYCKELREEGRSPDFFCNPVCECGPFLLGWNNGLEEITHWMPLPEYPEVGEDE